MFHICFSRLPSEHFSVLNVAKATFVGKKFRALQLFYLISSHNKRSSLNTYKKKLFSEVKSNAYSGLNCLLGEVILK